MRKLTDFFGNLLNTELEDGGTSTSKLIKVIKEGRVVVTK